MKKLLMIALAILLVLSLAACGDEKETTGDSDTDTPVESTTDPDETTTEPDETTTEPESTETTEPESAETTTEAPSVDSTAFIEVRETVYVFDTDILNIRTSCSVDSEKVGEMKEGESVVRTGYNAEWSRILYNGEVRYASSEYLTTTAPLEFTNKIETVYVAVTQLNLRAKPSASENAKIVVTLDFGAELERTGVSTTKDENGDEWSRLLYNGQVCYADSSYLSTTPSVSATLIFEEKSDVIYTIPVNTVYLREDASLSSTAVAVLGYGVKLERTGLATAPDPDGITWSRVLYNGKVCYISSGADYITTEPTLTFAEANETLYVTGNLKMRATPYYDTGDKNFIRILDKGSQVHCIGKATAVDADGFTWYKVEIDGITGYASASYLSAEQPE